jgi:thioredoxin 1
MKNLKQYGLIASILILIIAFGVIIAFSSNSEDTSKQGNQEQQTDVNKNNPAAQLSKGEIKITDETFDNEVKNSKGVMLVDFYSPTCPACQKVGPIISEVAEETQGKYRVGKVDVTANPKAVATLSNFKSVPALIFYKDGKEVDRLIGVQNKQTILSKLDEVSKK